jgi:hypothetical protein
MDLLQFGMMYSELADQCRAFDRNRSHTVIEFMTMKQAIQQAAQEIETATYSIEMLELAIPAARHLRAQDYHSFSTGLVDLLTAHIEALENNLLALVHRALESMIRSITSRPSQIATEEVRNMHTLAQQHIACLERLRIPIPHKIARSNITLTDYLEAFDKRDKVLFELPSQGGYVRPSVVLEEHQRKKQKKKRSP